MTVSPLAQAVLVAYCGWDPTVTVTDSTVTLSGDGTPVVALPSLNVTAVSSVIVTNLDGSTYTATTSGDFPDVGWESNGILTWLSGCNGGAWAVGSRNIAVTYSGGYDMPDDIAAALDSLSTRMPISGAVSKKLGSAAITYASTVAAGGLLLVEEMVFDRYRLPRVA